MTDAPTTIWTMATDLIAAQAKIAELENALAAASGTIAAMREDAATAQAKTSQLNAALKWYAAHVADCRKLGLDGNVARGKLDRDGGSKARAALKVSP